MKASKTAVIAGILGAAVLLLGIVGPLAAWVGIAPSFGGFSAFLLAMVASPFALGLGVAGLWHTRKKTGLGGKRRARIGSLVGLVGVSTIGLLVVTRGFTQPETRMSLTDVIYQVAYHPDDFVAEQTREFSPVNDISSDLEDPPLFPAAEAEFSDLDWSHDPSDAAMQETVYPGVKPLYVGVEPPQALEIAVELAKQMGWTIREIRQEETEFEAYTTSKVFGFVDDISVRMRRSDKCVIPSHSYCWSTAVDIRSRSRDGESDIGANATRICAFYDQLWVKTGLRPDQSRHRCFRIGRFSTAK